MSSEQGDSKRRKTHEKMDVNDVDKMTTELKGLYLNHSPMDVVKDSNKGIKRKRKSTRRGGKGKGKRRTKRGTKRGKRKGYTRKRR